MDIIDINDNIKKMQETHSTGSTPLGTTPSATLDTKQKKPGDKSWDTPCVECCLKYCCPENKCCDSWYGKCFLFIC